jgi:opacity protein-like surface antigen
MSGAEDETWTSLSLGGGIKFFMSKGAAIRWEYRFQKFSGEWDYTYHNMFLGVSAFLK